jgi:hypothetical protein
VVRLANRTAERLVGQALDGKPVAALGLAELVAIDAPRTIELALPGGRGTWEVRPSEVRGARRLAGGRNRVVGRGAEAVITLPSTVRERAGYRHRLGSRP